MNNEYDSDQITCSDCGGKFYPEVGMSPCPHCSRFGERSMNGYDPRYDECGAAPGVMGHYSCTNPYCSCNAPQEPSIDIYGNVSSISQKPSKRDYAKAEDLRKEMKYRQVIHETDKAKLFSIKLDQYLYEIWIPKSCILKQTDKKVTVSSSFYTKSVLRQAREQNHE